MLKAAWLFELKSYDYLYLEEGEIKLKQKIMEQLDLLSNVLRWLRYVQEYKLSALFDTENQVDIFQKPNNFPKIPEISTADILNIEAYRKEAGIYQKRRKIFKDALAENSPGFYMNFLSVNFFFSILKWFEKDGRSVRIDYLYLPGFIDEKLVKHGINTYKNENDLNSLTLMIKKTMLFMTSYKITLSDGLRTMTIKCYEHNGVVSIWDPSFTGDVPNKNFKNFFRFVARMSHEDIIKLKAWWNSLSFFLFK